MNDLSRSGENVGSKDCVLMPLQDHDKSMSEICKILHVVKQLLRIPTDSFLDCSRSETLRLDRSENNTWCPLD